ncbi:phosphonate C-P lyase system protein PhnG [Breoghania sp. L-A4]|uniref:phosphonate C-P lyase system protein PhnG n=1 Tax=Breoghania sp. L-A4 TaxID=2304600 RepID=UPI000E3596A7|nr:phosphonate C-P lyase system protein PhnG [Breoghania sp. L-A4]AXS39160.1 phosphonate C-P lyase system protein PhnG [Breoghania sp. L-A4]
MTRQEAMTLLARAPTESLRGAWETWSDPPAAEMLRGPESGMIMLRGRIGGGGAPFNLGETTVSRATVRLDSGEVGFSCVLGRDLEKARLAAVFDGLWQRPEHRKAVEAALLAPLARSLEEADRQTREEAAATKVNFFTMVRGEDE